MIPSMSGGILYLGKWHLFGTTSRTMNKKSHTEPTYQFDTQNHGQKADHDHAHVGPIFSQKVCHIF